jgi:hypothetical protein
MPGTNAWAEQFAERNAMLVNTRQYVYGSDPNAFEDLQGQIERQLDPGFAPPRTHRFVDVDMRPGRKP